MFYDLDDPGKFLDDVKQVLAPDGLFVIEQNYLPRMLEDNRVDNISAEHLCYYSLGSILHLLDQHKFCIKDIEFSEINGGVFRLYIEHMEYDYNGIKKVNPKLIETIKAEDNLKQLDTYQHFIHRVQNNAKKLKHGILGALQTGTIDIYGASTRGLTILQLADLGNAFIRQAVDRNPAKWGKLYNGILVVSEEEMRKDPPDYLLILAQGFLPEFIEREWQFLKDGGKFILPFDKPRILSLSDL